MNNMVTVTIKPMVQIAIRTVQKTVVLRHWQRCLSKDDTKRIIQATVAKRRVTVPSVWAGAVTNAITDMMASVASLCPNQTI
jgi:hypothetical protein